MKHTCRGVVAAFLVSSALVMVGTTAANALDPLPIVSDTNMANRPSNDRELHIAVDPNDPNHLAAGANTRGSGNGQRWYVSTDGGTTWTDGVLPFGTINSDGNPTNATMSDPSVAFGSNGEIYYSALTNGSNAPCDLFVSVSSDDGATWTDPANGLIAEGGTTVCNDKQMILVDNANNDNVYAAWTPFGGGNNLELVFSRDTGGNTGGLAFSAPVVLSTDSAQNSCQNHGADLAQQANGDLYVSWTTFCNGLTDGANSTVWVARSTDLGLTFSAPVTVAATDNVAPNIATGFRARTFPSIEADPATGRLFVVYSDYTDSDGGDADILISSSSDNGATWTAPSEVDVETDTDQQVMPWVDVSNGRVVVAFYSNDGTGAGATQTWSTMVAYGAVAATPTFAQVTVSSATTAESVGFIGDYLAVAIGSDDVAHVAWGDGRTGVGGATDAYSARVDFAPLNPDTTAPTASPTASPAPNGAGWNNSDVTVTWNWTDNVGGSGIDPANCTTSSVSTGEGNPLNLTATCKDLSGNEGSASYALKVDKTAPTLNPVVSPNPVYLNGSASVTSGAADALSGLASESCGALDTTSVGSKSVTCTATDNAGNTSTASVSYAVTYKFTGFGQPIDGGGTLNKAKAGQAVPLKWRITDANDVPVTNLAQSSVVVRASSLACALGTTTDAIEEYVTGSSGLQSFGDGYYQWNWKTPKSYGGSCKTMRLDLGDSVTHDALFQFSR